ncbi:MAG: class I tRNA ligase family protein [bacterium]|nr:class I tRNA ligase family protein [bacterium]
MAMPYPVHVVEERWRARWNAEAIGQVDLASAKPERSFYNLVEFPYPSAEGLHVGHMFRYVGVDAFGRYKRMCGYDVFQPIGFDSFGIHTENYALQIGEHPQSLTERTTSRYQEQLSRIGAAWDWSRAISTSDPEYYRWTQWVLVRLFRAGLMYQDEATVLWCPSCLTVLAREQTERNGAVCERCDTSVEDRIMTQWFLRTTAYAERLLAGLDDVDWPDHAKVLQRQWIGREVDGNSGVRYRMHDWLISRQRYWGPPIPIIHCASCGAVPVPEDQLPVALPEVDEVQPTGTGESPLAGLDDWVNTSCPSCGGSAQRETDVSDTFVDSAWYFLRYPSAEFDDRPWDAERTKRILPVDFYAGGIEHVQRHHLYARFVIMALYDLGLVPFEEPFPVIRLGGLINLSGAKMSKSRGNVISPDSYIDEYGSDVLRCALMFSAPWDRGGEFSDRSVAGVERFLSRCWRVVTAPDGDGPTDERLSDVIVSVTEAIEQLTFNVALARLMEFVGEAQSAQAKRVMVRLLAPFAPHLAEELWHQMGESFSIHNQLWPVAERVERHTVEVIVQVNGKVRGVITVAGGLADDAVVALARTELRDVPNAAGTTRTVVVPDRVVNFVT